MKIVNAEKGVDKLVDECTETVDEEVEAINNNKNKCNSCIVYIVLFSIFFIIKVGIGAYFAYYKYVNHNKKCFLVWLCLSIKKFLM